MTAPGPHQPASRSPVLTAMRDFRRPRLWLNLWWCGCLLAVVLSLIHPPEIGVRLPEGDKVGHFLAYLCLSAWSVMLFTRLRDRLLAAIALLLLGVLMELAQGGLTSDRMMDARDAVANGVGVMVGQLASLGRLQRALLVVEQKLGL